MNALTGRKRRVAYLMSWFPTVTETFILDEMLELDRLGMRVDIFPLMGAKAGLLHPGAGTLRGRTRYFRLFSAALWLAQLAWLKESPRAYLRAWWKALRGNLRSPGFFFRACYVVPKAALIARELRRLSVEHVHSHWATHPTLAALIIRELTGLSYSFTCHAHDLFVNRTMLEEKLAGAAFVATISEYNRQRLAEWYGDEVAAKTAVVRCGVDPAIFQPRRARVPGGPFILICVASLRDYKGHPQLIEACRQLKARKRSFQCLLVGDGEERAKIAHLISEAGLSQEVHLLGAQPRNEVRKLLLSADAMVMPSVVTDSGQMEGIPVSLMEAMACELPAVATAISGIPELIDDERTGLLVPQRDPAALAQALERLILDPELARRLGRAGRERILADYNLPKNIEQLHAMLIEGSVHPMVPRPEPAAEEAEPAARTPWPEARRSRRKEHPTNAN